MKAPFHSGVASMCTTQYIRPMNVIACFVIVRCAQKEIMPNLLW